MGNQPISLKGERWHGQTTLSPVDRGQRRMLKIRNGYVNQDGSEIRQWPGSFTLLDLTDVNQDSGYGGYVTDTVLPIYSTTPTETYQYQAAVPITGSTLLTMIARAKPTSLHCFEQIGGQLLIIGESRFREQPLLTAGRVKVSITQVENNGGLIRLTLSAAPGALSATDAAGAGLNGVGTPGLSVDSVVYCEDVTLTSPAAGEQAAVDGKLNRRVHQINAISSNVITLQTTALSPLAAARAATGQFHIVSFNRSNTYDNTNGLSPYNSDPELRIDDPTALTSWRVAEPLEVGDSQKPCLPSWVANRQRDWGDRRPPNGAEGVWLNVGGTRGVSRREKLELPYRVNPECATDRVILAAPAYGCMFQVPVKIPNDPDGDFGIAHYANDVHDKPRALGVPKARMVECFFKDPPTTPTQNLTVGFDFQVFAVGGVTPTTGLAAGEYQIAISFEDDALGEEGLASEPATVTIPSVPGVAYTVLIPYLHPGYVMPECLAFKMNVYLATPGADDLSFYASFPLRQIPIGAATTNNTNPDMSGKYGFLPAQASASFVLHRYIQLPLLGDTSDVAERLDPERLAPQSAQMPRGADACRFIRGVLLSGGHLGNTGGALQLWVSKASATFGPSSFQKPDEIYIRVHGNDASVPSATIDGDLTTHTFGAAGRAFPSAYQGVSFHNQSLLPADRSTHQVDRVINRMTERLSTSDYYFLHRERLRLTRDAFNRTRAAGTTPTSLVTTSREEQDIFWIEPKGQLQLGDPGAPNRASPLFIRFIDPNKGDDITAIGNLGGTAIVCSQRETYSYAWYRNPGSEEPNLMSDQFGCIAANSMVEFDGGLAWMSARGPVAIGGNGLQHIGLDIVEDFHGPEQRYLTDSRGMMRHCWGAHDEQRGLVLWGLVTTEASHLVEYEFASYEFGEAGDGLKSRFPCDEVLIWSYRTNSFSTWRPPAGQEILWMRPLRDSEGRTWMCYLAADQRIYALDESAHDENPGDAAVEVTLQQDGRSTTTLTWTVAAGGPTSGQDGDSDPCRDSGVHLREDLVVEFVNSSGQLTATRTIASITTTGATTSVELSAATSWDEGDVVRIGPRQRMTIITTFVGAEAHKEINTTNVHIRHTLFGNGGANCKVTLIKTDAASPGPLAKHVAMSNDDLWGHLGRSQVANGEDGYRVSRRKIEGKGGASSRESALKLEFTGTAQVRVADILLDVA